MQAMKAQDVKILLLQLRKDQFARDHEVAGMVSSGRLEPGQLEIVNGLEQELKPQHLDGKHLFIIGGSGDYDTFDLPFCPVLKDMLAQCRSQNIPLIGSCWGAQFMAHALGGKAEADPAREEVGSYLVSVTEHASDDPLFHDFPSQFWAQIGHHVSVTKLPDGAVNLASSTKCQIQAFTWPGSTQYGLQFHPDLTKTGLMERVIHYRDAYAADPMAFDIIMENAKESPSTDHLLQKFIERIVLPRYSGS